ncbi:MAG: 4-hydroxy-tetrahydrodipicolinate reductase [Thermodesulfobacteriota bacterium]
MTRVIVAGAGGRMGRRIIYTVRENPDITLTGAFEHADHPCVGLDAGELVGVGALGVPVAGSVEDVDPQGDVLIDFTSPEATLANVRTAAARDWSLVIGTTGITGELLNELKGPASGLRCVMAPNMSVGMNLMFRIAAEMARVLGDDYDMEILETHHRFKKDAPSGTALHLARLLAEAVGRELDKTAVYERKGIIGERGRDEIGIQTWRAGDITGEHTVMFGGIGERLELIHRAHNRDNFARGAIRAARWVVEQPVGFYDMQDVLGLK